MSDKEEKTKEDVLAEKFAKKFQRYFGLPVGLLVVVAISYLMNYYGLSDFGSNNDLDTIIKNQQILIEQNKALLEVLKDKDTVSYQQAANDITVPPSEGTSNLTAEEEAALVPNGGPFNTP